MIGLIAALMIAGSPAQDAEAQTVWRNVAVGMTREQIQAAYPERIDNPNRPGKTMRANYYFSDVVKSADSVQLMGRCHADYAINYPGGVVTSILVSGTGNCVHREMYGALIAKYGQPMESRQIERQIGLTLSEQTVETRWIDRGVMVSLVGTDITYTVIGDTSGL